MQVTITCELRDNRGMSRNYIMCTVQCTCDGHARCTLLARELERDSRHMHTKLSRVKESTRVTIDVGISELKNNCGRVAISATRDHLNAM